MKHQSSQALFEYWNTVRAGRIAPKRFDIEPGRLGSVLPESFILERSTDGRIVYRLAGTKLCQGFGMELRGRDFLEGLSGDDRMKLKPHLDSVIEHGAVSVQTLEIENSVGAKGTVEVVVLPLIHTRGAIDRFLGCTVWLDGPIALKEQSVTGRKILNCHLIWPGGPVEASPTKQPRHSDPAFQTPFLPHIRNARIVRQDRRQFRVYDGGLSKPPSGKS
ncbi:MAG: PAS domain-containing protein [Hyphomicrobium sp.]